MELLNDIADTDARPIPSTDRLPLAAPRAAGEPPSGAELRRSLRFLTSAWLFGSIWMTATSGAPLTHFARSLGASNFQFGLLSALPFLASLLSLPAALLIDRTGERKRIFLWGLYIQRLSWIPIAVVPLVIMETFGSQIGSRHAMTAFLLLVFFMFSGQSTGGPAWVSWMADLVPDRARGRYFGRRRSFGILTAVPTAIIVGLVLDRLHNGGDVDPIRTIRWCAVIFIVAALIGSIDVALHHAIPEIAAPPQKNRKLLEGFSKPLKDPQFLLFAGFVGSLTFAVSFMGQFVTLYVIKKLNVTNMGTQLMLLVAPALAQLLVLSGWGRACDRMGKKPVMALASLGLVPIGLGWCFMNGGAIWLGYFLSAAGAALWAGVEVANMNMVLEMSGSNDEEGGGSRTSYVAVNSVIINIAGCLGGLSSGLIAQSLGDWTYDLRIIGLAPISFYEVLFAMSGLMRLLAVVVFLPRLHEPEARPAHEALRFMTSNIYNNLFNAVFLPLRLINLRTEPKQGDAVALKPTITASEA